jgi:hypothetical protein
MIPVLHGVLENTRNFPFYSETLQEQTPFSYVVKGKGEVALVDAIKVYEESGILAPLILNLDNR